MKYVYLVIAAMMLLCLAPMPYGYYMLVRFVAMVVFAILAIRYFGSGKMIAAGVFAVLALLFQPFFKVVLGRGLWNAADVIVAILMVALYVLAIKEEKQKEGSLQPLKPKAPQQDNRIEFSIGGRLQPRELVYVAAEEDPKLTALFEQKGDLFEGWGKMIGYEIVYLPLLLKRLKDKRVLRYRAPYLKDEELEEVTVGNDFLLQYLADPSERRKIRQGFIRTENIQRGKDGEEKAVNRFYALSSDSGEDLGDQLHRIGKQISEEEGTDRYLEAMDSLPGVEYGFAGGGEPPRNGSGPDDGRDDGESTEELMEEVRERVAKLRQRGIAEYILEQLIHPDNRLSRMVITRDWRIVLPDYNDMEIKMEPLVKAVYLLYLKHPEGIAFKQLPDYREELTQIYAKLRPLGLSEKALQSIGDVTNPLLNSINEKCARIRAAFVGQFDDYMAKNYYIDGPRGEAKKIALPRNLVDWEEG